MSKKIIGVTVGTPMKPQTIVNRAEEEITKIIDAEVISDEKIDEICIPMADEDGGIPIASKSHLGCVIVGDNLNVRENGTIYADKYIPEVISNSVLENILK